jgi:TonB family protein
MKGSSRLIWLLFTALTLVSLSLVSWGEDPTGNAGRKLLAHPSPQYPALARTMNLSGTVKLEAVVGPNGSVKSIDVKGGSPVLAQSAQFAVRVWKWEKADHETVEPVEIHFNPQN